MNFNYSNFEYYKNYKFNISTTYTLHNYISKQLLYMLTKKRQHFFFYTENDLFLSYYMYNFEMYKQLFIFGDWYAGYLTNYINVRQNLLNVRSFSNNLFVNTFQSNFSLYKPQAYIFLDTPRDTAAFSEFKKLKTLYFEDPKNSVYANSYFFLVSTTFYFFFNLYFLLFQLAQSTKNKKLRLYKKSKGQHGAKLKNIFRQKIFRTSLFFYNL